MRYFIFLGIIFSGCINASCIRRSWDEYHAHKAYEQKKHDKAMSIYTSMLQKNPYNPEINYNLGTIFYEKKQFKIAQDYFNRAAQYSKDTKLKQAALFALGNALYHQKLLQQALDAYEKVLELHPENQQAKQNKEYIQKLLEQKNQQPKSDDHQSDDQQQNDSDKQQGDNQSGSDKNQKNEKNNQKNENQKNNDSSSQEQQDSKDQNQKGDQSDQKQSNKSDDTKNSKQNKNVDEKKNTHDEQDTTKDLKKSEKDQKDSKNQTDQKDSRNQKDDDLKKDESAQQHVAQQDTSDSNELTDAYAAQVLPDAADDQRLDKRGIAVMQTVAKQEEDMQKAILKFNVSKKGDATHGQKNW